MFKPIRPAAAALAMALALPGPAIVAPAVAAPAAPKRNLAREEKNRALVLYFCDEVFAKHNIAVAETMLTEDYIQHNPRMASGRAAFIAFFKALAAAQPDVRSTVVRSSTDGDLVYVHARSGDGTGRNELAIVNIFRVADGKIAEHWDVVQPVPPAAANTNTMF